MGTLQTTAFATASGTPPHPRRHPNESQDPVPSSAAFAILGPDFRQDDGTALVTSRPPKPRHSRGGGNPDWLALHQHHRPPRIWIPACAGMTMRCVTRRGCMMAMMPMAAHDQYSLPFRGGSGWGMSTRARPVWRGPYSPSRRHPSPPARRVSPRRRGPRLGSRLRGRTRKRARKQGRGSRPAKERARLSDPTTSPDAPKNRETRRHHCGRWSTCKSAVLHAPRSAPSADAQPRQSRMHHLGPKRPYRPPYRAMCRTL